MRLQPAGHLLALVAGALVALALVLGACGGGAPASFPHGVASGDAQPGGAVLWTRADREATLLLEVATDEAFEEIVLEREVRAEAGADYTVKVEVTRLEPATAYSYRFRDGDSVSATGSFRTAPALDTAAPVRFIFSGDTDGTVREDGTRAYDFAVLDTARAENADFFIYFGDTIYGDSPFGEKAVTIDDYRAKYKENREVEPLRSILAAMSTYTTWDDHEVENDFAGTSVDPGLLTAGRRAFREYTPIGGDDDPNVLYRSFRWGSAVEIIVLDARSFRDEQVIDACTAEGEDGPDLLPGLGVPGVPEAFQAFRTFIGLSEETPAACLDALNDPDRTMLGAGQKQFLLQALEESEAMFKFIVNPVPIMELVALPYDRWEGYRAERDEVLSFIKEEDVENVIFLTTDYHSNIVADVRVDLASAPVAVEFVTGPIAHSTLGDDIAEQQSEEAIGAFEALLTVVARVECTAFDSFSYGLVEIDPDAGTATVTLKDEDGVELCSRVLEAE